MLTSDLASKRAPLLYCSAVATAVRVPPWPGAHYVGIDENGMGPRLGPLVVTAVLTRVDRARGGDRVVTTKPRGALATRIGDSKKLVAFDDNSLGEAWARAIVGHARPAANAPLAPTELISSIALDPEATLREPCPSHHLDLCWGDEGETFSSTDANVAACTQDLARLAAKGVEVLGVRVAIVCTKKLNAAVDKGLSRFDVDLHTMERLTLAAREEADADVYALCGKVGGFNFYGSRFGPLSGRLFTALEEGRARSTYQLPGVGRLSFLRDADDSHLLVGLASLVGKWVRDHLMRRVVRFHRIRASATRLELPDASGYHDPVTTRFIDATKLLRKQHRVATQCFERTSLAKRAGG